MDDLISHFLNAISSTEVTTESAVFKMLVSMSLGGAVGFERKRKGQIAGMRTFALIAMGATMAMLLSIYIPQEYVGLKNGDPGRIAAQVITGIGFLGAGAIIQMKGSVRGLTTAAGLWVTAAIGLACGTGMYLAATIATVMVLFGLEVINALIPQLGSTVVDLSFSAPSIESIRQLIAKMRHDGMDVRSYEIKERRTSQGEFLEANLHLKVKRGSNDKLRVIDYMDQFTDVTISAVEV